MTTCITCAFTPYVPSRAMCLPVLHGQPVVPYNITPVESGRHACALPLCLPLHRLQAPSRRVPQAASARGCACVRGLSGLTGGWAEAVAKCLGYHVGRDARLFPNNIT